MPKLRNHEAWVENDIGERFEEYGERVGGNVVTCYIASESEKVSVNSSLYHTAAGLGLNRFSHYIGGIMTILCEPLQRYFTT